MPVRLIRDGILTSEPVCSLTWPAEILYRRLMSVVDDYGRFHANPRLIRAACYPLQIDKVSDADIGKWLTECVTAALVSVYPASDGKRYLQIEKFGQQIRSKSKFPTPDGDLSPTSANNCKHPKTVADGCEQVKTDVHTGEQIKSSPSAICKQHDSVVSNRDQCIESDKNNSKSEFANIMHKNDSKSEFSNMSENHDVSILQAPDNSCEQMSATAHLGVFEFGDEDEDVFEVGINAQASAREENRQPPPDGGGERESVSRFDEFWEIYPVKISKKACFEKWKRKRLDRLADEIIGNVRLRLECDPRWLDRYVPNPLTYLNQERWNDELPPAPKEHNGHGNNQQQGHRYPKTPAERIRANYPDVFGPGAEGDYDFDRIIDITPTDGENLG